MVGRIAMIALSSSLTDQHSIGGFSPSGEVIQAAPGTSSSRVRRNYSFEKAGMSSTTALPIDTAHFLGARGAAQGFGRVVNVWKRQVPLLTVNAHLRHSHLDRA
jgi:hypothetical protein